MIGLKFKITDEVGFSRRDHNLHPCLRMKQVSSGALFKGRSWIQSHNHVKYKQYWRLSAALCPGAW